MIFHELELMTYMRETMGRKKTIVTLQLLGLRLWGMGNDSTRSVRESHMGPRIDMRKDAIPIQVLTKQESHRTKSLI